MSFGNDNEPRIVKIRELDPAIIKPSSKIVMIGKPGTGKSSIIDIILFSIFGEVLRDNKVNFVHYGEKQFNSDIILDVNNVKYRIIRKGKVVTSKDGDKYIKKTNIMKQRVSDTFLITNEYIDEDQSALSFYALVETTPKKKKKK